MATKPIRILLVEDNPDHADLARHWMLRERPGLDILTESYLDTALLSIAGWKPEAIVLDLKLPNGEGAALIEAIRQAAPNVPLLVFTGHVWDEATRRVAEGAVAEWLSKDQPSELMQALRRAVERMLDSQKDDLVHRKLEELLADLELSVEDAHALVAETVSAVAVQAIRP